MRRIVSTAVLAAACFSLAAPVLAADDDSGALQEIVVTAARVEQNVQKVSAAVTVISGDSLTSQSLTNVGDIFATLPSVQTTGQPGGFSIDIRGLGGDLPAGSTQGSVALVFDGVYNINSQGSTVGFFDVDRVEVLPGPQSTRYGPNADGGLVNVYTKDPVLNKFGGDVSLTQGNYDARRGEFALNLPLGDVLAIRLSGAAMGRDSYFTPEEGAQRAQSGRIKVLYQPLDGLSMKLTYQLDHIGGEGNGSNVFPVYTNKVPVYPGGSINDLSDPWSQAPSDPVNSTTADIYQRTLVGNLSYQFASFAALDVLASDSTMNGGGTACIYLPPWSTSTSGGPVICDAQTREFAPFYQYTGEVRLHSAPGNTIIWDLGYYHWNYLWQYQLADASFLSTPPVKTATDQNAVYGEATYPVTDTLRVIGGLRESHDHRAFDFNNSGVLTPTFGVDFSHFDYRAGVEYDVQPESMLYATVSTGYRPGGYSSYNPVTNGPNYFASEVNTAFEFGSKNRFLDNRLQVNADIFYYHQANYQNLDKYSGFIPSTGGAACTNGDTRAACVTPTFGVQAHSLGVETQIHASVTRYDLVGVSATWLDAKFNQNQGTCATVGAPSSPGCWDGYNSQSPTAPGTPFFFNLAGAVQPHSPKFSGNLNYEHDFVFSSGAKVAAVGEAFYTTGYWVNPVQDATLYGWQPSYWLGNLRATYSTADEHWSVTAFVRNVGDYAVKESVLPAQSIGDPRTYGGTLTFKW
jgi:outer membrane receptor protein involved in Fe transport